VAQKSLVRNIMLMTVVLGISSNQSIYIECKLHVTTSPRLKCPTLTSTFIIEKNSSKFSLAFWKKKNAHSLWFLCWDGCLHLHLVNIWIWSFNWSKLWKNDYIFYTVKNITIQYLVKVNIFPIILHLTYSYINQSNKTEWSVFKKLYNS